jgi:hypothetical protein
MEANLTIELTVLYVENTNPAEKGEDKNGRNEMGYAGSEAFEKEAVNS